MTDGAETVSTPPFEELVAGEASDEQIAAWNERVEQDLSERLDDRLAGMADDEQAAVEALLAEADETAETELVEFPSGLEIEVTTRIPPGIEHLKAVLQDLESRDAPVRDVARVNCQMLALVCKSDGYDSQDVWMTAYEQEGIQWLHEMTDRILEPVREAADSLGNGER